MMKRRTKLNEDIWSGIQSLADIILGSDEGDKQIPLDEALQMTPNKTAMIIGSSQAGVMGPILMKDLEERQFEDFKFIPEPSKTLIEFGSLISSALSVKADYDVIVIYPGYKSGEDPSAIIDIIKNFEPARCFVVLPPPVTVLEDPESAASLGLNSGDDVPPDYWFLIENGRYAQEREDYCTDLRDNVIEAGSTVVDPRDAIAEGIQQQTGVVYPNVPDGIHPTEEMASTITDALINAIFDCKLPVSLKKAAEKSSTAVFSQTDNHPMAQTSGLPGKVTSGFGMRNHPIEHRLKFHQGIDIGVGMRTPVKSVLDGVVVNAVHNHAKAGNYVEIKHPSKGGIMTRYLHLDSIGVEPGQEVSQGEDIGLSGKTGSATGPHLHFEVWPDKYGKDDPLDPLAWLNQNTDAIHPVDFD